MYNLSALLLLCANDVETNPGPLTPLARGPNLEKAVTDLRWQSNILKLYKMKGRLDVR